LHLVNVRDATSKQLFAGGGVSEVEWEPNARTVYVREYSDGDKSSVLARAVDQSDNREIVTLPSGGGLAVSPDGRSLAYSFFERATKTHRVIVREISGGSEREVFRVQAPRMLVERGTLDWTPDGRHLVVVESGSRDRVPKLWSVPLAGGEPREIMRFQGLIYPRLHPDGRRLLLRGGGSIGEVWVLEQSKAPPSASMQSP
jgi:Tol biopolymer transport system component